MNLDFRNCKTKEDVEEVFKEHKEDFEVLDKIKMSKEIKICHDENCPNCEWCETLIIFEDEKDFPNNPKKIECYKCGWKKELK